MNLTNEQILSMCKDKLDGMPIKEIAKKYGVSESWASRLTPKMLERNRESWYTGYLYPNIVSWMRKTNTTALDVGKHMGVTSITFIKAMKGKGNFRKPEIDKILALTGMTYEKAFQTKEQICKTKGDDET